MNIKTAAKSSLPALLPKYPSPNESNQPNLNCFNRQDRATRLRTTVDGTLALQRDARSMAYGLQQPPLQMKTTTPTLKPLRVDRAPA
jgi:hypothetical protein